MGSKAFQFKKFSVAQDLCTHKVGTDGVLLGAWVKVHETDRSVLDIGTGSGLIAIMLAQRCPSATRIDALDIEASDVQQAKANVQRSPWPEKIAVHYSAVQDFFPDKQYDLIVSNPPWFTGSLLPPDEKRGQARHTNELSFEDLLTHASRLLSQAGRLGLILPYAEGLRFIELARSNGLPPLRKCTFRTRAHKPPERLLLEFSRRAKQQEEEELILYGEADQWSEAYRDLTAAFYLKT